MLRVSQIMQLLRAEQFSLLVDRVLANGRCRSKLVRQALRQGETVEVAAMGLALQRMLELTYGPTAEGDELVHRLLRLHSTADDSCRGDEGESPKSDHGDGNVRLSDDLFGVADRSSITSRLAASAVAIRGLNAWLQRPRMNRQPSAQLVQSTLHRCLRALATGWLAGPSSSVDEHEWMVAWAIVLWQLGDLAEFRNALPVDDLLAMVDHAAPDLLEDDLSHYAHAVAA